MITRLFLAEAATVWQVRAVQAEDQLKQLTAGHAIARAAPTDPSVTEVTKGRASDRGALRRLWARLVGRG